MVRFRLGVLRGVGLAAMDFYGPLAKSDPYAIIMVDGEEIGRTATINGTRDPVWTDRFDIDAPSTSRIRVVLLDWDVTKDDDPMGEVSFVVGDIEKERLRGSPNFWLDVVPTDGSANDGKVELCAIFEGPPPKSFVRPSWMRVLRAGPNVRDIDDDLASARAPVFLHVYDVGHSLEVACLNRAAELAGAGIFHAAVQIYGKEYSFGGCDKATSGVFACNPAKCPLHTYRETVFLGNSSLSRQAVKAILADMVPNWMGNTYDILRKNCCSFSNEFAIELGVGALPAWTNRLANIGAAVCGAGGAGTTVNLCHATFKQNDDIELTSLLLEHVMAVRMQAAFRSRQARANNHQSPRSSRFHLANPGDV
ncbi:hypothetical protein CTAYLR_001740 [Chrysophaeum taylorii]|uniref:C2 domain-containing protein n=1 Tax=Chrysophaeum taylorii TaxID=2483200 RepID=A0AAD7XPT1_9STRA|nr:hypothetical protein CTAYLR_001740 [Chrysophaeum taylorii]